MDYEKLHKNTLVALQQRVSEGIITEEIAKSICADFVKDSKDDDIRKDIIIYLKSFIPHHDYDLVRRSKQWIAWLENQKPTDKVEPKFKKE